MAHTRLVLEVQENGLWRIESRVEITEAEALARRAKELLRADWVDRVSLIAETFTAKGHMERREVFCRPGKGYQKRLNRAALARPGLLKRLFSRKPGQTQAA